MIFELLQMVSLYRDPQGEKIFRIEGTSSESQSYHIPRMLTAATDDRKSDNPGDNPTAKENN